MSSRAVTLVLFLFSSSALSSPVPVPQSLTEEQFRSKDRTINDRVINNEEPGANRQSKAVRIFSGYSNVSYTWIYPMSFYVRSTYNLHFTRAL